MWNNTYIYIYNIQYPIYKYFFAMVYKYWVYNGYGDRQIHARVQHFMNQNSNTTQFVPVVPHKAVAEVSKIGNLYKRLVVVNQGWQSESTDGPKGAWGLLSFSLFLWLSTYLPTYLSMYLSIYLSVYLSIFLSIYLCIYLSIYLCIYVSIYPSINLSICLSIYLSIYLSV